MQPNSKSSLTVVCKTGPWSSPSARNVQQTRCQQSRTHDPSRTGKCTQRTDARRCMPCSWSGACQNVFRDLKTESQANGTCQKHGSPPLPRICPMASAEETFRNSGACSARNLGQFAQAYEIFLPVRTKRRVYALLVRGLRGSPLTEHVRGWEQRAVSG